ncbi:MAG: tRNA (adenosine(37)-N6)-dimethylallyltransferase MiaA [Anaerorhabdus sp.]
MIKVIVIVGPTGVGKSDFSIGLAKALNGEIISGDSVQIYKGFDIGSGKITNEEMDGIKHYGIDILDSKERYSVKEFQKYVRDKIKEISDRKKTVIIVGGTGLYIKACLYDYEFKDEEIDKSVFEKYNAMTNEELMDYLKKIDSSEATKIHVNNRKRLIRACIIYDTHKVSKGDVIKSQKHQLLYDAYIVGCTMDRELLYDRINKRVLKMIDDGLEKEVRSLTSCGVSFDDQAMSAIGYKEWKDYLNDQEELEEIVNKIQSNSRKFARRQYTFFNNQLDVNWINMNDDNEKIKIVDSLKEFLNG